LLTEKAKLGFKMEGGMGIPGAPPSASEIWYVALMGMGPEARSEFSKLVKGLESEDLRGQTIAILGEMGPDVAKSAIPDIVKSLKADDPSVRQAIIALGKMGPAANAAVPALRALLAPPLPKEIIDLGNDALKKIEGK
jgi:HEAT repeat protein